MTAGRDAIIALSHRLSEMQSDLTLNIENVSKPGWTTSILTIRHPDNVSPVVNILIDNDSLVLSVDEGEFEVFDGFDKIGAIVDRVASIFDMT